MSAGPPWLLALDLAGTFAFGLNGALTAVRAVRLDIVGVITLGMITALGGGIIRDILLDDLPPATFQDWRYLGVAAGGAFIAFLLGHRLHRLAGSITVFDAVGLSVFAVTGASKALDFGIGPAQAVILGTITGVGGGTLRDVLIRQVPSVLSTGLYAVPALVAAAITVAARSIGIYGWLAATVAATACLLIRLLGVHLSLNAPEPPGAARIHLDSPEQERRVDASGSTIGRAGEGSDRGYMGVGGARIGAWPHLNRSPATSDEAVCQERLAKIQLEDRCRHLSDLRRSDRRCEVERQLGPLHDLGGCAVDIDDHSVLVGCQRLKRFHFGTSASRPEVVRPSAYLGRERVWASMEVKEPDPGTRSSQDVAIVTGPAAGSL